MRRQYKAIQLGDYNTLLTDNAQQLYAFSRKYVNEEVIVIINRSNKSASLTPEFLETGKYKDVYTKKQVRTVNLRPMDVVVLSN